MKRFSKLILSVAAVSAVSAAMVVSASAAMTATYENGVVTLADVTGTGASQTLLVLDEVNLTTVAESNIKQIDQKDDSTSFTTVTVGELADGTYEVRIGGSTGEIQTATFTVGEDIPPANTTTLIIGDIDETGDVDSDDATAIARGVAGQKGDTYDNASLEESYTVVADNSTIVVGDIDGTGDVDSDDATALARGVAGQKGDTYDNATLGDSVEVYVK